MKQKEAMEAAKREHELELARLEQEHGPADQIPHREDRAKTPKLPSLVDGKGTLMPTFSVLRGFQLTRNGIKPDGLQSLVPCCQGVHSMFIHVYWKKMQLTMTR